MISILANDGLDESGIELLKEQDITVDTQHIPQAELPARLNQYDAVIVRSATQIGKEEIDAASNLKLIIRAGVGMDNVAGDYAREKGIQVMNTPRASSQSVAELVFAHIFSMARFLYAANRSMPVKGATNFNELKKAYSKGIELRGKTIGIIGFGGIGQTVAKMALGLGMNVMPFKLHKEEVKIAVDFFKIKDASVNITMRTDDFDELLAQSDFITLHVPFKKGDPPVLYKERLEKMKKGAMVVNSSRGGVVVEEDLLDALNSGHLAAAALDVFEDEPMPHKEILEHPRISLSPHIGASTVEAQERVGVEVAQKVIEFFRHSVTV